ncbi:MAG: aminoacyl-tRNA hydrolase [Candidatus Edwardsbacteria bacterium]|nr:aminoacyl-tRNA hydrolase [Candidatus Edwardsbacteria bacterium]
MKNMWCVAGLGNPGRAYVNTRHNAGFMALDALAARHRGGWTSRKLYDVCELPILRFVLIKPAAFMNVSGQAVRQALKYRGLEPAQLLVVCDDLNLPLGKLRFRPTGSDGGHNGLKSVIESLQTDQFARLRMGIGQNSPGLDAADYVLSKFGKSESAAVKDMIDRAAYGLECLAGSGVARTMNVINQKNQ